MARGKSQRLRPKRRRLGKTDYHRRMRLLRSGAPRAVVRVSNTQVTCQLISYNPEGDSTIESVNGKSLVESYSWPADSSKKSVPACYLAGICTRKEGNCFRQLFSCIGYWPSCFLIREQGLRGPQGNDRCRSGSSTWRISTAKRRQGKGRAH